MYLPENEVFDGVIDMEGRMHAVYLLISFQFNLPEGHNDSLSTEMVIERLQGKETLNLIMNNTIYNNTYCSEYLETFLV